MKLALIGASGFVGAAVLQEALNRGHQVTAIVRNP
ncbi:NAD(P)H-binding protein, partial [Pseudomonas sp.]